MPTVAISLFQEFDHVVPTVSISLIEHQVNFIPRASIPSQPAYRSNPSRQRSIKDKLIS
jgi:hypothetical protein